MEEQSQAQRNALQLAVEKGQQAWRDGKSPKDNPYPPEAPYYYSWQQGWEIERDLETS